jgi:tetratricopeptide (TPR) repeat protein
VSFTTRTLFLLAGLALAPTLGFAAAEAEKGPPQFSDKTAEGLKNLQALVDAKNWDAAITLLQNLAKENPPNSYDDFFIEDLLGKLYWQGKDAPALAVDHFLKVMAMAKVHPNYTTPKDMNEHILWVARASYQKAVGIKNDPAAQRAAYDEAARYLKQFLATTATPSGDDEFLYAMLLYSKASAVPGKIDLATMKEAEAATKKCMTLQIHPKNELYQLLVAELVERGDYKTAADYFEILVKLKPTNKDFWAQLFQCYNNIASNSEKDPKIQRIYYARAINTVERAQALGIMKAPRDNFNLVSMYYAVGQFGRATDILHAGLKNGSIESNEANWTNLSYFYQQVGDNLTAISSLKEAMTRFPQSSDLDFKIAQIYQDEYNTQETYNWCKSAVEKNHFKAYKAANAYQFLAYSAFELQKYDEALVAVDKAIELSTRKEKTLLGLKEAIQKELKQREVLKKNAQ